MKILLKGSFNQDDLKEIADVMRGIDMRHRGAEEFFMLISSPNETLDEADQLMREIFPAQEDVPYEIKRFLKNQEIQSSDKPQ